jgi:taurine dioxygenase
MLQIDPLTPAIGAELHGLDLSRPLPEGDSDAVYAALIAHLVIFIRATDLEPAAQLAFAQNFGSLDEPHPLYPHVDGYPNIVLLENDAERPADTNSWHTDLTFKAIQPFASILLARAVPASGGDTLWSSCYAAWERLPDGMRRDLEGLEAIHDMGDFRNSFATARDGKSGARRLDESIARFGHQVRPLVATHPVSGRKYLNFNEAFVTHIVGLTSNDSNALRVYLANHMNKPELQVRWRWRAGDLAMWDNRVTMHYAVNDYLPAYRCMNRVTVIDDRRGPPG